MRKSFFIVPPTFTIVILAACLSLAGERSPGAAGHKTLNVLFIGNSYTARHKLPQVVKAMAEAGDSNLRFDVATVIYGGRRLVDHWRLGTQNCVRIAALTPDEEQATIKSLEKMFSR